MALRFSASEIGGVFAGNHVILAGHAEGGLVAAADGVDLVTRLCTVKINRSVVVNVAHGHRVGVAAVAGQGQHAGGAVLQNLQGLFLGQQLAFSSHFSEHVEFSF